ncbi:hypothetical protein [Oceanomicrobium pacificus]|uniref:Uncharacterized protein n=1 Tax=Oceanomicrobium pacificus TaxID=2692916 RepID=A0A6B0TYH3_9RHOB|nr:hypothetical protein [Oceanomicrobium pacificus]MXU66053.1 hypothetical protein [Oceanomicrobium pacificus]
MLPAKFYQTTYAADDVARLCQMAGLKPQDPEAFHQKLEDCAAVYRWETANYEEVVPAFSVKRELHSAQKRATALQKSLSELSDTARQELLRRVAYRQDRDAARHITGRREGGEASLLLPSGGSDDAILLGLPDIEGLIDILSDVLGAAISEVPKRPSGPVPDFGLYLWAANIRLLWEETTDAPFTRDATEENIPITPAALFCVEAFKPIEPSFPRSRVLHALKLCIQYKKITGTVAAKNVQ